MMHIYSASLDVLVDTNIITCKNQSDTSSGIQFPGKIFDANNLLGENVKIF